MQDILTYTEQKWGFTRREKYAETLEQALHTIKDNPNIGPTKHCSENSYRIYSIGKHKIIYLFAANIIHVLRVLHARMDSLQHLDS